MKLYTSKVHDIIEKCVNELSFLWEVEPLEGDQTIEIGNVFLNELDMQNGNIHKDDYEAALKNFDLEYLDPTQLK
ncbi:MAG: hypothetical protein P4L35_04495 [Ignavibacteriaceae bacterium]|nr:hypothetical protein [Ignavibacteriaceae bacterium]